MEAEALSALLQNPRIWRGYRRGSLEGERTGFAALDRALPGHGWPRNALIELITPRLGIGELQLLLPVLRGRPQSWVAPPHIPYAPALHAAGMALDQLLLIYPQSTQEALWATEQILRAGTDAAVLGWQEQVPMQALRRLQLAAEAGECPLYLFRPRQALHSASPAALRLYLEADPQGLQVRILKSRGGRPGVVLLPRVDSHDTALVVPASRASFKPPPGIESPARGRRPYRAPLQSTSQLEPPQLGAAGNWR